MPLAEPNITALTQDPDKVWDVVVIGSGYGAAICAARLAEAYHRGKHDGQTHVVILERGKEWESDPTSARRFPDQLDDIKANVQIDNPLFRREHRLGLYNFHVGKDLDVLVGCGLGGTSLINANVTIRPDGRVFGQPAWPSAFRADPSVLDPYFRRAWDVLQPSPYPDSPSRLPVPAKLRAMESVGARRCDVNVHFGSAGPNSVGVQQKACTDCGDCVTGCNNGAKKTLCFNYLPLARSFGAKIFVQCDVDHIAQEKGAYSIYYQELATGKENAGEGLLELRARRVVVAAGVMGSAGILLRSRDAGLSISPELGGKFSGNGDALAFAYNCATELDSVGFGQHRNLRDGTVLPPTGPTILGVLDRPARDLAASLLVEEGAFASGVRGLLESVIAVIARTALGGDDHGFLHWFHDRVAALEQLAPIPDPLTQALNRTLLFLIMGHDGSDGVLELDSAGRASVRWPQLGERPVFSAENDLLREIAGRLGGTFISNPLASPLLLNNQITVHPLGGCAMGDDGGSGVVDHRGRVFDADGGRHDGLYVADGLIVPTSLGVNPLWTISALAERVAEGIANDLGIPLPSPSTTLGPL